MPDVLLPTCKEGRHAECPGGALEKRDASGMKRYCWYCTCACHTPAPAANEAPQEDQAR